MASHSVNSAQWSQIRYKLRIVISAYPPSRQNIAVPVGMKKTKMAWLPDGEKNWICLFVFTEFTNVTDGQTHTRTDTAWRHRPRLHSIARQKCEQESAVHHADTKRNPRSKSMTRLTSPRVKGGHGQTDGRTNWVQRVMRPSRAVTCYNLLHGLQVL